MSFLMVEQALADFNTLNVHIRKEWSMSQQTAFIAFGRRYGANLAMWLRLKNPNLWAGAIASSATPLKHVLRETNGFALIETEVYGNVSSTCPELIRSGWAELYDGAATKDGRVKRDSSKRTGAL
jgi:dipeptidyl-peptidase-2